MEFLSVKEAAAKWGISERRVRALCESGRIEGATRCGDWVWSIPAGTVRPADGRTLRYMKNRNLRTGSQDYRAVDALRKSANIVTLTHEEKALIIEDALAFDNINLSDVKIKKILNHENTGDDLSVQIAVLNLYSLLSKLGFETSEKSLKAVNERLNLSIDEKNAGLYRLDKNQAEEAEALFCQYAGPWSILHPVARAAFLFSEIIRIEMFRSLNAQTAFVMLENEFIKAKLPPVVFGKDNMGQLKAALVSSQMRGNSQTLVSMILEAVEGK